MLICACLPAATGCNSKPKFIYDGSWHGNRNLTLPDTDRYTATTIGDVSLSVKETRYELSEMGIATAGNVVYKGDHVELQPTELMERPLNRQSPDAARAHPDIKITPQPDGSILFDNPAAVDGKPVGLNKVKD